jgi:hypothetical protein
MLGVEGVELYQLAVRFFVAFFVGSFGFDEGFVGNG